MPVTGGGGRVAILGPAPPDRGGIAHETSRLAEELSKKAAVEYFTFSRRYPRWLDPRRYAIDPRLPAAPAVPILDYASPRSWKASARRIAAASPDALLVAWWTAFWALPVRGLFRALERRHPATARLLVCHNVEDHEGGAARRGLSRAAFAAADAYVVHSEEDGRRLSAEFPGRRVAVLPLPAPAGSAITREEARRRLGVEGGPLVLFLGLIRPYKGVDVLLRAAPRIVRESNSRIAIVGEVFRASRRLKRLLASSPVRDRILWKDQYLSEDEMGLWLAACDLVVLPYKRISASAIAARAIGAGKPIVASAVGGLAEAVLPGVTGELFPVGDAEALAQAVGIVLSRGAGSYAPGLEIAARRASWTNYAAGILEFIAELVSRKP